jgi:HK97 family phage portal protein
MGLGRLFHRAAAGGSRVPGAAEMFTVIDGSTTDWTNGMYRGGMSIPGAWRASVLLSDLLGGVPWCAYRERAGGPPVEIRPTPPLLERPAYPDVRMTTFSSLALDLVWEGNAVMLIAARDREGWPTSALPVPARYVGVRRVSESTELWPVGAVVYDIGGTTYGAEDVIHIKGPAVPGALRGMGVLENHLHTTLALAAEQGRQARAVGSAGIPSGTLKSTDPDFDEADAIALKASWLRNQRERTIAVLNATTEFQALSWNPTETQLLEARRFSLHELALIFGVPLYFLGADQNSRTYSNLEDEGLNLLKFHMNGHLTRFEQTLSAHMPRGTSARADLDAILRSDTLTRYQAHGLALGKWLTVDEIRAAEHLPPLTPAQREALTPAAAPRPAAQEPAEAEDDAEDPAPPAGTDAA